MLPRTKPDPNAVEAATEGAAAESLHRARTAQLLGSRRHQAKFRNGTNRRVGRRSSRERARRGRGRLVKAEARRPGTSPSDEIDLSALAAMESRRRSRSPLMSRLSR